MAEIKTLTYSEDTKGWTSFWDYQPSFAFSVKGRYFTTNGVNLYEHYANTDTNNHGYYYGTHYPATVSFIFNDSPSFRKTFKTINYEGSNGWEMDSFVSDSIFPTSNNISEISITDSSKAVKSFQDGQYNEGGVIRYAGFRRKGNKYYANLVNNSVISNNRQVRTTGNRSGVKGFFAEVTMSTDESTRVGGQKQLFSVGSEIIKSLE